MPKQTHTFSHTIAWLKQGLATLLITLCAVSTFSFATVHGQGLIDPNDAPDKISEATGGEGSLKTLTKSFLDFILGFLGFIAVVMIIYGGFLYVTAAGEQDKVDKGKKIIMYALIGIVIIMFSFVIVNTLLGGLGAGDGS